MNQVQVLSYYGSTESRGGSYRRSRYETSSNIFRCPNESLIVVCCANDATGHMSREAAFDHVVTWSENVGALSTSSLWRHQAVPTPSG